MGIVNATPDSFSDGGRYLDAAAAIAHGLRLSAAGAEFVDVGGESTRPGALPVDAAAEIERTVPVVRGLVAAGVDVSIDTGKAVVAAQALSAGATLVNDVTALRDPEMAAVVAHFGAGLVLMHMRGTPRDMQRGDLHSDDIVADVERGLGERLEAAVRAGISETAIALDPGIGFGKTALQNVSLMAAVPRLKRLGRPVLVGVSRKSVLGALTERPVESREAATTAAHALLIALGVDVLRVHDVEAARDAARVAAAFRQAGAFGVAP